MLRRTEIAQARVRFACYASISAAVSRDLPIPASPDRSTTWPSPVFAFDQRRSSSSSSSSRPTSSVRPLACSASKRLSTAAGSQRRPRPHRPRDAFEVLCPPGLVVRTGCRSAFACSQRQPRVFGSAMPLQTCSDVRRLADNPLAPAPHPTRSDRRLRPIQSQCRRGSASGVLDFNPPTAWINSSPARTARSASSSWACG